MANNNNRWHSPAQAFTASNNGEQAQHESSFSRENGDGRGNDSGRGDGIQNDQGDSSYSLKVNFPKMNGNNYNAWDQTIRWPVSSMKIGIGKPYMFLPSAKDVWEAVRKDTLIFKTPPKVLI
ncbi:hypothetical protein KIW84_012870 [Lathyrus oleraceus]|uniref:Retrotransposon Copia-like N-terminal domain-containing protein n=1 Tax=Pisum sativum TaxID=3888 RepID=A0A9D5GWX7_PEA|nr:hypothetical protein KIW84_012870 [Pisum sativum]